MSWKIDTPYNNIKCAGSTSLWGRELKDYSYRITKHINRRPPCEVVSWKTNNFSCDAFRWCRPPCEVVSWKKLVTIQKIETEVDLLVRSWVERWTKIRVDWISWVDLLVRSWVERMITLYLKNRKIVDLLVRSWVERMKWQVKCCYHGSTSLWGRELKDLQYHLVHNYT